MSEIFPSSYRQVGSFQSIIRLFPDDIYGQGSWNGFLAKCEVKMAGYGTSGPSVPELITVSVA